MNVDIKSWPEGRILAPAVATKEATDGDSNWLPRRAFNAATVAIRAPAVATQEATDGDSSRLPYRPANETAVAIRKARKLANGWRKPANAGNGYRELRWQCPFCAELHSVLIPESWIAEGKVVFVEPKEGE